MIVIKNKKAIDKMRTAGRLLAQVFSNLESKLIPGISTLALDQFVEREMLKNSLRPECKGYAGYKYATCISINDVIVHGVPSEKKILKSGDFVKIDSVGSFNGYCADMARSFFVGKVGPDVLEIDQVAKKALKSAISKAVVGNRLSDISSAVQKLVEAEGFNVIRDFAGHGIGKRMHEKPDIPNYGEPGQGPLLRAGMTLAIEPMIVQGSCAVKIDSDGWSARTSDGKLAAHIEDTVLITNNGPEIFTRTS